MKRAVVAGLLACAVIAPPAWAKGHKDDDTSDDDSDDDKSDDAKPAKGKGKADKNDKSDRDDDKDKDDDKPEKSDKGKSEKSDKSDKSEKSDDDSDSDDASDDRKAAKHDDADQPVVKQDLNGHDLGGKKGANEFEHDRFFVDKTDTKKTDRTTLIQGSLTSTTFAYTESGGPIDASGVTSNSPFTRVFTDLRLQTDFRHISGGRWDGRVDVRGRIVTTPDNNTASLSTQDPGVVDKVQSGAYGDNELDLRELWLIRNGERSDVTIGRQYITDLAATKIDGIRVDYASSTKLTYLGFGGLYPVRGSRSVFTDYPTQYSDPDPTTGERKEVSKFTGAGGFGAAYRTPSAYGAVGGVALVPLSGDDPRLFVTSNGYLRSGSTLDFYHFAVVDLASGSGLTNLSAGVNYKPTPQLRLTANLNHVDTESLNVQANAFLNAPDVAHSIVQNETYVSRISTNELRGGLSAGLGPLQRFQITVTGAFRYRPSLTLTPPGETPTPGTTINLDAAESAEIYAGFTDRHSIADLRLGIDASRVFGVGDATYQRTSSTSVRGFAGHELLNGHGEWEAEIDYLTTKDDNAGVTCGAASVDLATCYGAANATIISLGGTLYYRINRDWFVIGSLFLNRENLTHVDMTASTNDPAITGITGFFRAAYRF